MTKEHGPRITQRSHLRDQVCPDRFPQVEKAVLYGSRAKDNHKVGSDIDLALFGDELDGRLMSRIYWALDDLLLPYKIDLPHFAKLRHQRLVEHIRSAGISIYDREGQGAAL